MGNPESSSGNSNPLGVNPNNVEEWRNFAKQNLGTDDDVYIPKPETNEPKPMTNDRFRASWALIEDRLKSGKFSPEEAVEEKRRVLREYNEWRNWKKGGNSIPYNPLGVNKSNAEEFGHYAKMNGTDGDVYIPNSNPESIESQSTELTNEPIEETGLKTEPKSIPEETLTPETKDSTEGVSGLPAEPKIDSLGQLMDMPDAEDQQDEQQLAPPNIESLSQLIDVPDHEDIQPVAPVTNEMNSQIVANRQEQIDNLVADLQTQFTQELQEQNNNLIKRFLATLQSKLEQLLGVQPSNHEVNGNNLNHLNQDEIDIYHGAIADSEGAQPDQNETQENQESISEENQKAYGDAIAEVDRELREQERQGLIDGFNKTFTKIIHTPFAEVVGEMFTPSEVELMFRPVGNHQAVDNETSARIKEIWDNLADEPGIRNRVRAFLESHNNYPSALGRWLEENNQLASESTAEAA